MVISLISITTISNQNTSKYFNIKQILKKLRTIFWGEGGMSPVESNQKNPDGDHPSGPWKYLDDQLDLRDDPISNNTEHS